jgi:hypothetical protein
MMKGKVTRFPITEYRRIRNLQGDFSVPCEVSERWLAFDPSSSSLQGGEFISVDVMTMNTDGNPRNCVALLSAVKT